MPIFVRAEATIERSRRRSMDLVKVLAWIGGMVLSWATVILVAKVVIAALG
jgi:hypothetical protein